MNRRGMHRITSDDPYLEPVDEQFKSDNTISQACTNKRKKQYCCMVVLLSVGVLICLVLVTGLALIVPSFLNRLPTEPYERAVALLKEHPLIDGHNDLAYQLRIRFENQLDRIDLTKNTSGLFDTGWHTDIARLRAGHVGAQFWSAYIDCASQYKDATRLFIDQVDVIKRMIHKYSSELVFATSAADIESAYWNNKIASLIGIEGGHAIDSSLATLRQFYDLGARYMTLTHNCNTPWAHCAQDNGTEGLNSFGKKVIREMNRLGMLVDISHVNKFTMMDVLEVTSAPVIFSHSSSYTVCKIARNVPDDVLEKLSKNDGIIMVNFLPWFVNCSNPRDASLKDVADHIMHLIAVAGADHVGIGSDFDGFHWFPKGLEDVSKYPYLFAELISRNVSDSDIIKISRENLIRVFKAVEKVADYYKEDEIVPDNSLIEPQLNETCRTDF